MWSLGEKEEMVPMSRVPKSIFGIPTWQARNLYNQAVLVKIWSHLSLTLHHPDSAVRWSSEICDSSSWLASGLGLFHPTMKLIGKFLFLAV